MLSIAALVIDSSAYPHLNGTLQAGFIVFGFLFFIQGQAERLYFFPRAEDKRRLELLSNSYSVKLTHEETVGYYNNDQKNPLKRLAASIMESAFFTAHIVRKMLLWERAKVVSYVALYIFAMANRSTNLDVLAVIAQVLFSEAILSRWLRMEWLRARSELVLDNLNSLFMGKSPFSRPLAQSQAVSLFTLYETTKSTAAILLSSRQFQIHNDRLTIEWERIRGRLGI